MASILTALGRLPDVRAHVVDQDAKRDRPAGVTRAEPGQRLCHQLVPAPRFGHVERQAFKVSTGPYLGLELRELVRGPTTGDHGCAEFEKRDHDCPADALTATSHDRPAAAKVKLAAENAR